MTELTHTSKTIIGQLELYEDRAKNLDLTWCEQVYNLIKYNNQLSDDKSLKINDIGCNYFQFYKEIKRRESENLFNYFGYDIDQGFINLGLKYFPELNKQHTVCNVENTKPRKADISLISATLEHAENPFTLLSNVLDTTSRTIILRTFFGESEEVKLIEGEIKDQIVLSPYYINQFSLFKIMNLFLEKGFTPQLKRDLATNNSIPYDVTGSGTIRQMYILLGIKNKS